MAFASICRAMLCRNHQSGHRAHPRRAAEKRLGQSEASCDKLAGDKYVAGTWSGRLPGKKDKSQWMYYNVAPTQNHYLGTLYAQILRHWGPYLKADLLHNHSKVAYQFY